jgi:hypothetical protein
MSRQRRSADGKFASSGGGAKGAKVPVDKGRTHRINTASTGGITASSAQAMMRKMQRMGFKGASTGVLSRAAKKR